LHGRPFPLNGSYYANIFVHYVPIDHDDNNNYDPIIHPELKNTIKKNKNIKPLDKKNIGGHEQDNTHEDAIEKHLMEHDNEVKKKKDLFLNNNINNKFAEYGDSIKGTISKHLNSIDKSIGNIINKKTSTIPLVHDDIDGRTALHLAAMTGNIDSVEKLLEVVNGKKSDILYARDINGWQAIHEAARANQLEVCYIYIHNLCLLYFLYIYFNFNFMNRF
jgi:ankyrin repeat protein